MFSPELLFQLWEFGQQHARAYALQPLHDLADILSRVIRNEDMDMIAGYLTANDLNFALQSNLSQKVPGSNRNWAGERPLPLLGYPDQVDY